MTPVFSSENLSTIKRALVPLDVEVGYVTLSGMRAYLHRSFLMGELRYGDVDNREAR
jgi:hypothetical protein